MIDPLDRLAPHWTTGFRPGFRGLSSSATRFRSTVRMRRAVGIFALLLIVAAGPAKAQSIAESIRLFATNESLTANGYSSTVVTAEVRDRSGSPIADGTEVRFATTLGTLDTQLATTRSGRARVTFTSAAVPGQAVITATSGHAVRELTIPLLTPGEQPPEAHVRVITVSGRYVAYSSDYRTMMADGDAVIKLGSIQITAGSAQIDLDRTTVRASGDDANAVVTISSGAVTFRGARLWYDWMRRTGAVRLLDNQPPPEAPSTEANTQRPPSPVMGFSGPPFAPSPGVDTTLLPFEFQNLEDTQYWVVCRWAAIFPGQRIHFRSAEILPQGQPLLRLPYHSLSLNPGLDDQYLGIGSMGLTLDIPYYMSLTDRSATSIRLGMNQPEGSFGAIRGGLGLDLRHQLFVGDRGEETIDVSRFTSKDWGLWWRHSRQWSDTTNTNAFVDFVDHRDLFANGSLDWQGRSYGGYLNFSANLPKGFGASYFTDLTLQTHPQPLAHTPLTYSFVSGTFWAAGKAALHEVRQTVQARLALPALSLTKKTTFNASFGAGQVLTGINRGPLADATLSLSHRFSPHMFASANYSFLDRPDLTSGFSRQRIGGMFGLYGARTSFAATISRTLDGRSMVLSGDYSYNITSKLRANVRMTSFRYSSFTFSDLELALAYPIGAREVILYWSKTRHRLQLELGGFSF